MTRTPRSLYVALLLGALSLSLWSYVVASTPSGELTVVYLDVGQGDAIYIEGPHGTQILIDGGKGRAVLRALGEVMPFGDRTLDVILATHPDQDHIGGLPDVLRAYEVGMVLEPGVRDEGADYQAFLSAIEEQQVPVYLARSGLVLALGNGAFLEILYPVDEVQNFEANTGSVITRLVYGTHTFLFTGDAPRGVEMYLAGRYGAELRADVLKLGHHGSNTSSGEAFIAAVAPTYGIVSAGCDNSYGHPHGEVVARVEAIGATVLETCDEGNIRFTTDGATLRRE